MKKQYKRIMSFLVAITMVMSLFAGVPNVFAASYNSNWAVSSVDAFAGEEVEVPVYFNTSENVFGGNFTLQYDSQKLEAVSLRYDDLINDCVKNHNLNYQNTGNQIRFTFSGTTAFNVITVAYITFKVKDNVEGDAQLTFIASKLYDENATAIESGSIDGTVSISIIDELSIDTPYEVIIDEDEEYCTLSFIPEETGAYSFYSISAIDTYATLYNSEWEELDSDDDAGDSWNFKVSYLLEAGEKYYLQCRHINYVSCSFTVVVSVASITALDVSDIVLYQGAHSYTEYEYNEQTGEYDLSWERYNYYPDFSVTLKDGSVVNGEGGNVLINGEWNYLSFIDDQSYENQWTIGNSYTVTGTLDGVTDTFTATVLENPVESIDVDNVSIIEGTNQQIGYDWIENEEVEYLYYDWSTPKYTVNLKNGDSLVSEWGNSIEIGGQNYWLSSYSGQSSQNVWGVGDHTVQAEFFGIETTYTVTITESPIKSISVEDIEIPVGFSCYKSTHWIDDVPYEYTRYNYVPEVTVEFKDGTTQTFNGSIQIGDDWYGVSYNDDQAYNNEWGIGEHTASVELLGKKADFTVKIVESPVASVVVNNCTAILNVDGYEDEHFIYYYNPSFTVTMNDGTTYESISGLDDNQHVVIDDEWYYLDFTDSQSETAWGLGTYQASATIFGKEATFNVTVVENPVDKVIFEDISVIENIHGYYNWEYNEETDEYEQTEDFIYQYTPKFTVILKDGTEIESTLMYDASCVMYNGFTYWLEYYDGQEENPWEPGVNTVNTTIMGKECSFDVNVIENTYTAITISGENELNITFTKTDGSTESYKATSFSGRAGDDGYISGYLYVDNGAWFDAQIEFDISTNGFFVSNKNIKLTIGGLTSNTLETNNWLLANGAADEYKYAVKMYRWYTSNYDLGRLFRGYNGILSDKNIDAVITLSVNSCYDMNGYDDYVKIGDNYFVRMDAEVIKKNVKTVFGIDDIDLTKSAYYDPNQADMLPVLVLDGGGGPDNTSFEFVDGEWVLVYDPGEAFDDRDYDTLRVTMNPDATIKTISFANDRAPKRLESIAINTNPTKTTFVLDGAFDYSGLTLKAEYDDGTSEVVTSGFNVSGFNSSTIGNKTITVNYEGKTVTYTVSVVEAVIDENSPVITASNASTVAGNRVKVNISLKNNPGIASATVRIKYNTNVMTLVDVIDAGNLGTSVHSDQLTSPYVLNWVNDTITNNITFNGDIVTLVFEVKETASLGKYDIEVSYNYNEYDIYNVNAEKVKFYTVNGSIDVVDVIFGDANSDGSVNNLDRLVLTRYLANWSGYTEETVNLAACDLNNDGSVNNLDRLILTRYLANWSGYEELPVN